MVIRSLVSACIALLALSWTLGGCAVSSVDDEDATDDTPHGSDASDDTGSTDRPDAANDDVPTIEGPQPVALRIEPDAVDMAVTYGIPGTRELAAVATWADGSERDVTDLSRWTTDAVEIAEVDAGVVTSRGRRAGTAVITCEVGILAAEARIAVTVESRLLEGGVDEPTADRFDDAELGSADAAPTWEYPEDQTVYPAGIVPPLFQWNANGNALFRLRLRVGDEAMVEFYTTENELRPLPAAWDIVAHLFGTPIELELAGTADPGGAGPRNEAAVRTLVTVDAELAGSVYYWQVETGDIMRIEQGATSAEPLFSTNVEDENCRGCHSITLDGDRIGFMYNGGSDPRAGLAWVDDPEPPIVENGSEHSWTFMTFDPSGTRAVATTHGDMWMADVSPSLSGIARLDELPSAADGESTGGTAPSWSPDGSLVAYARRPAGPDIADWNYFSGDLMIMRYDPDSDTFAPPELLVGGGTIDSDEDTIAYPTWTPDSNWMATGVGPDNRGTPPSTLHLVDPNSGAMTHLARGAPTGTEMFPRFSPFIEGGYYWLLFYSRRPYGHVTEQKQLWVMAIDDQVITGVDGSHPAFWLPGQDTSKINITGVWSTAACRRTGQRCKSHTECCVGFECIPELEGGSEADGFCRPVECTLPGRSCGFDDECCPGNVCAPSIVGRLVCQREFGGE